MLLSWGAPIVVQALILGLTICLIVLPATAVYRQKKDLPIVGNWLIVAPLLILYFTGIIAFTFLPLPDPGTFQCSSTLYYPRFFVGWSLEYAFANTQGMGFSRFANWWFVQIYLNVLLFIPWGIAAKFFFGWSFRKTLLSAFAASLFIELTQLTGIWGYFDCRYRTFDVDDILTNTTGAVLGWLLVRAMERIATRHNSK